MNTQQELSTVLSVSAKTNYFSAIRPEYGIANASLKLYASSFFSLRCLEWAGILSLISFHFIHSFLF